MAAPPSTAARTFARCTAKHMDSSLLDCGRWATRHKKYLASFAADALLVSVVTRASAGSLLLEGDEVEEFNRADIDFRGPMTPDRTDLTQLMIVMLCITSIQTDSIAPARRSNLEQLRSLGCSNDRDCWVLSANAEGDAARIEENARDDLLNIAAEGQEIRLNFRAFAGRFAQRASHESTRYAAYSSHHVSSLQHHSSFASDLSSSASQILTSLSRSASVSTACVPFSAAAACCPSVIHLLSLLACRLK